MKQIICIGGFGWKHGDDRAGWETFINKVIQQESYLLNEAHLIKSYLWNDEISLYKEGPKVPLVLCGRSWGAARLYKFADDNPDVTIDLAVTFDPIPNPMWGQWGRWKLRPNIKHVVSFIQHENLLLRGSKIQSRRGSIYDASSPEYKITCRFSKFPKFFDEYEIPNDLKVINSLGHVMITKNEWVISKALQYIEGVK